MKTTAAFFVIFILSVSFAYARPIITEAMVDPAKEYNGNYNEWVEIYNDENISINLSGYKIDDKEFEDHIIDAFEYIVVAEKATGKQSFEEYYGNNDSIWDEKDGNFSLLDAASFSFDDNSGEIMLNYEDYENILRYNESMKGYSIEKEDINEIDGIKSLSIYGSPGKANSIWDKDAEDYNGLSISEFLADPEGDDIADMPAGEWIELYNEGKEIDIEGLYLGKPDGRKLYITKTNTYDTKIGNNSYLVVYMNGKNFVYNDGFEEFGLYYDDLLIDRVSYDSSKEGLSWSKNGKRWINTYPTPGEKNKAREAEQDSKIQIANIYDLRKGDVAYFGDTIRIRVEAYKGDTNKETIKIYVEDDDGNAITKQARINLEKKFGEYAATLPLHIPDEESFGDGKYYIIAEGLDDEDKEKIEIKHIDADDEKQSSGKVEYIVELAKYGFAKDELKSNVEIINNDDMLHSFDVWSYVYRGSKSYSGEREENKVEVNVDKGETKTIELVNRVNESGEYKIKALIKKDEQKTNKDFTDDVLVFGKAEEQSNVMAKADDKMICPAASTQEMLKENIVFKSSQQKAQDLIPIILIISLILFIVCIEVMR